MTFHTIFLWLLLKSVTMYSKGIILKNIFQKLPKKYRKKIHPLGIPFKVNRPKCWESTITEFETMILNLSHNFKLDSQFFERLSNIIQK